MPGRPRAAERGSAPLRGRPKGVGGLTVAARPDHAEGVGTKGVSRSIEPASGGSNERLLVRGLRGWVGLALGKRIVERTFADLQATGDFRRGEFAIDHQLFRTRQLFWCY